MQHPGFWHKAGPFTLGEIAAAVGGSLAGRDNGVGPHGNGEEVSLSGVASLSSAKPGELTFLDHVKYLDEFCQTRATACIVPPDANVADRAPKGLYLLLADHPQAAFARVLELFYPEAAHSLCAGVDMTAQREPIHPSAVLEEGVRIEPGAVIGAEAHIGAGSVVSAGAVIGYRVYVGRNCHIGPGSTLMHTLMGNHVVLHPGVRLGQDGFRYVMGGGADGSHLKVPQIGRVIIQDHVEIGANTTIDRGALSDTIIGEGSKIDNLVQIGHNVVIGRHCVIVAQVGISGSTRLGDYVVMGGQSAAAGHLEIGDGAQIAAGAKLPKSVPPGAKMGGVPAQPIADWMKEVALLKMLRKERARKKNTRK